MAPKSAGSSAQFLDIAAELLREKGAIQLTQLRTHHLAGPDHHLPEEDLIPVPPREVVDAAWW
jgi:hypothetical protein